MYDLDPLSVEVVMAARAEEVRRQAEIRVLQRGATAPRQGRRLLRSVGHQLVVLGEWLEGDSLPQDAAGTLGPVGRDRLQDAAGTLAPVGQDRS